MQTKTQGMRNVVDIASVRKANVVTSEGVFSGAEILAMDLPPISHIVSDMLTSGVYMLSGSPKVGKSFLALDMAVSISTGCEFLGHRVTQGTVLFFGLEDTIQTISQRLRMLYLHDGETECLLDNIFFETSAPRLEDGFLEHIENFKRLHHDLRVVVIDTMQMVVKVAKDYQLMSEQIGELKRFGDEYGVSFILVHHNRKGKKTGDPFDMMLGSVGTRGAVTGSMVMLKLDSGLVELHIEGKNIQSDKLLLRCDNGSRRWLVCDELFLAMQSIPPAVQIIGEFMSERKAGWQGSARELIAEIPRLKTCVRENTITKVLQNNIKILELRYGINFKCSRNREKRLLAFTLNDTDESD